ncbi:hypothetical protein DFH27DRAFT_657283 [Peziza echinospora]|nr:hypothetical protein DFH27DRAFT_657283 [Peziza echinospora]
MILALGTRLLGPRRNPPRIRLSTMRHPISTPTNSTRHSLVPHTTHPRGCPNMRTRPRTSPRAGATRVRGRAARVLPVPIRLRGCQRHRPAACPARIPHPPARVAAARAAHGRLRLRKDAARMADARAPILATHPHVRHSTLENGLDGEPAAPSTHTPAATPAKAAALRATTVDCGRTQTAARGPSSTCPGTSMWPDDPNPKTGGEKDKSSNSNASISGTGAKLKDTLSILNELNAMIDQALKTATPLNPHSSRGAQIFHVERTVEGSLYTPDTRGNEDTAARGVHIDADSKWNSGEQLEIRPIFTAWMGAESWGSRGFRRYA